MMTATSHETLSQWLRDKAKRTEDVGDATDFAHAAEVIDGLYEALADFIASADAGHVSIETDKAARSALAKARGEHD